MDKDGDPGCNGEGHDEHDHGQEKHDGAVGQAARRGRYQIIVLRRLASRRAIGSHNCRFVRDLPRHATACSPSVSRVRRTANAGFSHGVSAPVHNTPNSARRCCASGLASMMMVCRRKVPECTATLSPYM